ncbi:helix-turn-helix domain-containing protein [Streptomyces sp. NBC_01142]|uniref:helix-turn-helix transcriptional regulator n=1 Tax=Streptomyces sp. NBC_01142 TaxID=2975865 RepID=UPI00225008A8|nr:helix-turn-helix transcriptional regulator [Streptomyces sp. NBC_01142]MCX4826678.1 helix-turn-helix domain-containing protein [Streptomyces sp. NBC_01142]
MPERVFNALKFREAIKASGLTQAQVGADPVNLGESVISRYSTGGVTPPPEKLAALAERVGLPLDVLAPRRGLPDLKDLRCDAGLKQADTAQYTKSRSAMPVRAAENGMRRLKEEFEAPLAEAYGVSVPELKAAQERSFGNEVPAVRRPAVPRAVAPGTPQTVAEKITYLLEKTYAEHERPSDAELAGRGNMKTGRPILDEALVHALRTGVQSTDNEAVLAALAAALDAPLVFFTSDSPEEAARIVAGIRTVQSGVKAARHGSGPLPPEWLDFIADQMRQITDGQADGSAGNGE